MRDDLLVYYERELTYIRKMAVQFSEKYPKIAARLQLEPDKCEDPHVERMLEGFSFLAARVHLKIDDDFPEISEAMMSVDLSAIRPPHPVHVGRGIPARPGQGQTHHRLSHRPRLDPLFQARQRRPLQIPHLLRHHALARQRDRGGVENARPPAPSLYPAPMPPRPCASNSSAMPDVLLPKLGMPNLRFYLNGESGVVNTLYELLCANLLRVVVRDPTPGTRVRPVTLPASALKPVGFEEDEGVLPYSSRSFLGYRLLQEYFTFPEKFLFLDLEGLDAVWPTGFKDRAEIVFLISSFRARLSAAHGTRRFQPHLPPGLLPHHQSLRTDRRAHSAQPAQIRIPHRARCAAAQCGGGLLRRRSRDPESPDPRDHQLRTLLFLPPRPRDSRTPSGSPNAALRSVPHDEGTEVYLSLCDLSQRPLYPDSDALTVRLTCTNRDLPARLPFGNEDGDFELEANASLKRIVALHKPTSPIRPPMGKSVMWRLISQLSLNHLSLVEGGRHALQHILQLYNFTDSPVGAQDHRGRAGRAERTPLRPRGLRLRDQLRPRHPGEDAARRRAVRRQWRLPVCQRHGILSGPLLHAEQLQPAGGVHQAEKGGPARMAAESGPQGPDVMHR